MNKTKIKYSEQVWTGYYNSIILNPKCPVNTDIRHRTRNWLSLPYQVLVRTGISYKWNEKLIFSQCFRIEERFNQKTDKYHTMDRYNFSWRFRYKLDLQYPIIAFKSKKEQGPDGVTLNKISGIRFNLIHKIHA